MLLQSAKIAASSGYIYFTNVHKIYSTQRQSGAAKIALKANRQERKGKPLSQKKTEKIFEETTIKNFKKLFLMMFYLQKKTQAQKHIRRRLRKIQKQVLSKNKIIMKNFEL